MSETANTAAAVEWDLSALYAAPDDPRIDQTITSLLSRSKEFAKRFKGKINSPDLSATLLHDAVVEYEAIGVQSAKPAVYASLRFYADTADPAKGALMQRLMENGTEISLPMLFFELELAKVDERIINPLLSDPLLSNYSHFIANERKYGKHQLTEPEERILEETANTGSRAFRRLFEEVTSRLTYCVDGKTLGQSEVLAMLYSPDREVRKKAAAAFSAGLEAELPTLTFIFNALLQDKSVADRLRSYEYPEQYRHMSNELGPEMVELVVATCERNIDLVSRYYKVKREILGLDELTHYDRYAPLFDGEDHWTWQQAKDLVLESFNAFSPVMRDAAAEFFDKNWIDAAPRKGKRGGAFCQYATPDLHPFVMQTYLERGKDVTTLAHELGHGVHASLSRGQTYFNFHGTLPLAELASTFGEMLVFDRLQSAASTQDRLALYADKIEGSFATIFRQASMYRFEQRIHKHRREKGELTPADFGEHWQQSIQAMFGESLTMGEEHRTWWSYISHFTSSPFYVYAYSVGELLVLSLYQRYKEQGEPFVGRYLDVLRLGGSLAPHELMGRLGVDLEDPAFWQGGVNVLKTEVDEFEKLWQGHGVKTD